MSEIQAPLVHQFRANDHRQLFIVDNMLQGSCANLLGLLEELLAIPMRVDTMELLFNAVVLSQPESVDDRQTNVFVDTLITSSEAFDGFIDISAEWIKVHSGREWFPEVSEVGSRVV